MNRVINVMTILVVILAVFALVVIVAGCDNPTSSGDNETETPDNGDEVNGDEVIVYEIGDVGPAGGWIFYVDENDDFEWTYLEAAPADTVDGEIVRFEWSDVQNVAVGTTSTEIGTGLANTQAIVSQTGHEESAAQRCLDYEVNGYNDWFLPSRDELDELSEIELSIPELELYNGQYWSSSELYESESEAEYVHFGPPVIGVEPDPAINEKYQEKRVRAVRAF